LKKKLAEKDAEQKKNDNKESKTLNTKDASDWGKEEKSVNKKPATPDQNKE
jgi:hypothetical protein